MEILPQDRSHHGLARFLVAERGLGANEPGEDLGHPIALLLDRPEDLGVFRCLLGSGSGRRRELATAVEGVLPWGLEVTGEPAPTVGGAGHRLVGQGLHGGAAYT